jgi:putative tricarboxylic transport membrane protein
MDVPMLWDGYTMARRGEPAKALGWALVAALIGGLVSSIVMVALAGPMSEVALKFDSPDYFAAVFFGLTTVVALAGKSMVNSLISLCVGLLVATIGIDSIYGADRFSFGVPILRDGIELVEVLVGMYGLGEVLKRIGQGLHIEKPQDPAKTVATHIPTWRELVAVRITLLRSTIIGTLLGIVPGAGATITAFISYGIEKQYGRRRHLMGTGVPEGIVAPQVGATASVAGHMIPLLILGLPGSGATAVILAAFLLHGVQPGPMLLESPGSTLMVYTILASMFASVIGMCILGFFWIRVVIKVLTVPQGVLSAIVVLFCLVGAYANRNSMSDVWMIVIFGVLGYLFEKFKFPISPMVLGAILGPIGETAFTRSMISSNNDWTVFFTGPISGPLMAASILALCYPILHWSLAGRLRTRPEASA